MYLQFWDRVKIDTGTVKMRKGEQVGQSICRTRLAANTVCVFVCVCVCVSIKLWESEKRTFTRAEREREEERETPLFLMSYEKVPSQQSDTDKICVCTEFGNGMWGVDIISLLERCTNSQ